MAADTLQATKHMEFLPNPPAPISRSPTSLRNKRRCGYHLDLQRRSADAAPVPYLDSLHHRLVRDKRLLGLWSSIIPAIVALFSVVSTFANQGIFRISANKIQTTAPASSPSSKDRSIFFGRIQPRLFRVLAGLVVLGLLVRIAMNLLPAVSEDIESRTSMYTYTASMLLLSFVVAGFISKSLKLCGIRKRMGCGSATSLGFFFFFFLFPLFFLGLRVLTNPPKISQSSSSSSRGGGGVGKEEREEFVVRRDLLDAAFLCTQVYNVRRAPHVLDANVTELGSGWRLVKMIVESTNDVHALIARNPKGELHVSFAGSMTLTNWKTNFNIETCNPLSSQAISAHKGYSLAYNAIRPHIMDAVNEVGVATTTPTSFPGKEAQVRSRIHISGHSLGGGLAQIATVDFASAYPQSDISTYLFGSPSAGDHQFLEQFELANQSRYVSVVSVFDVIPALANTNFAPLRNEMLIVPRASSAFMRTGHSMKTAYYPTLMRGETGSVLDVASLALLTTASFVFLTRMLGFMNTVLTAHDKEGPFRNSRVGKFITGIMVTCGWGLGFFGIVKMVHPASSHTTSGARIVIAALIILMTRLLSSRWIIDKRLPKFKKFSSEGADGERENEPG